MDFSQTVDLKEQMEQKKKAQRKPAAKPAVSKRVEKDALDEMYEEEKSNDIKNIDRPKGEKKNLQINHMIYRMIILVLILALGYFAFFNNNDEPKVTYEPKWYKVSLTSGETYYGLITDISADPILIENVYYDYDQLNPGTPANETGNIRLVKRGEETHGPDGTLNVVRSQVVLMEPIKEDSKVLRAILEYEK